MVLEAMLRRERLVLAAGLTLLAALAWLYLWRGAGMGMSALDMTRVVLFPHRQAEMPGHMDVSIAVIVSMWWTMMVAMMTPSAAPLILLYTRVAHHHASSSERSAKTAILPATFLAAGYLLVWLLYSVIAATVQQRLQPAGLISGTMLWSRSAVWSAAVLAAAGVYQLTPLKQTCLAHCRAPVQFLVSHWRPGRIGAVLLGMRHGAYCVGCCWLLMALLFVGGVMNVLWIAALAVFVLIEKLSPARTAVGRWSGGVLLLWAAATLIAA